MFLAACLSMPLSGRLVQAADSAEVKQQRLFFENRIRPLLVRRCFECHANGQSKGGLQFVSRDSLLAGGESGAAVVPNQPGQSLLIEAVRYESLEMPPSGKLPAAEIQLLETWIRTGAFWPDADETGRKTGNRFSEEDRSWWAFQPVRPAAVPETGSSHARNAIDHFIHSRRSEAGLTAAPEADRRTLIRRLYADLIGLPPTLQEVDRFLTDKSSDAYEQLVDRLLESPRYGERWARFWLDLVRYSESDGYRKDDFRPSLWRYRDYVIRSFNADKPYDRFLQEQVAGDELAPDDPDAVTATAYWRLYLYEYNQRDVRTHWTAIVDELTDVSGEVFLGLGFGCARCHDHKFDPILRRDYFRLQAFFSSILPRDDVPLGTRSQKDDYTTQLDVWKAATGEIRDQIDAIEAPYHAKARQTAIEKFPPDIRVIAGRDSAGWSALDQQLMDLVDRQIRFEYSRIKYKEEEGKRLAELRQKLAGFDSIRPKPLPVTLTVVDAPAAPARTLIPGGKRDIEPGFLSLLDPRPAAVEPVRTAPGSSGRRTALARWLTDPDNPLTARVAVNRIWQGHFGTGIVATASDFGRLGEKPSHPELLDWLTRYFIEHGWSYKSLHRLICRSATYRQSAFHPQAAEALQRDPGNRLLWKWDIRRLDAEQIRDALLLTSGELELQAGGPSVSAETPRRSVYTKKIRNSPDALMAAFDSTDGFNSTDRRTVTTTPTQALLMINGQWMLDRTSRLARRVDELAAASDQKDRKHRVADAAWQIVYARSPDDSELSGTIAFLERAEAAGPGMSASLKRLEVTDSPALKIDENEKVLWRVPPSQSLPEGDFTIEAVIQLETLYPSANVRTIVSHWDGNPAHPGWNFGVTSEKSGYQPRNLILQLTGHVPGQSKPQYEVIASNLRPELGKPCFVAVSVDIDDTGQTGIRFYMQDLSRPNLPLQAAFVAHQVTGNYRPELGVVIGDRDGPRRARWHGLIDNVRLSRRPLPVEDLVISGGSKAELAGVWNFNRTADAGYDSSGSKNPVQADGAAAAGACGLPMHVLEDLCHVLLNSNRFLYID